MRFVPQDAAKKKNPHENHRKRLRETFRKVGVEGMPDHNLLELLLFYSIPRKDTNEIAHALLERFGSLSKVFDASYEQLLDIDGMGESSALLISLIPDICRKYEEGKYKRNVNLSEPESAIDYVIKKYYGNVKTEIFYMLCLDRNGNLINCVKMGEGDENNVILDKRKVIETALMCNADKVIFAHNHPNGIAAPSRNDIELTVNFNSILKDVGIKLVDHIIVADGEAIALAGVQKLKTIFI